MSENQGITTMDNAIEHKLGCLVLFPDLRSIEIDTGALVSMGNGVPAQAQLSTLQYAGVSMASADEISWLIDKGQLWDCDFDHDILCQIVYAHSAAAADTGVDWKAFIKGFAAGASLTDPESTSDGSITFTADTTTASAYSVETTTIQGFGVAGSFGSDELIGLTVELDDSGDASADECRFLFARLWYTREICNPYGIRQVT